MPTLNRTAAGPRIQKHLSRWFMPSVLAWAFVGCSTAISGPPAPSDQKEPARRPVAGSGKSLAASDAAKSRAALAGQEQWDVYYLGGSRLGYGFTRWRARKAQAGLPEMIEAQGGLFLSVKRFGEESTSEVKMEVVETLFGEIQSFASDAKLGPAPNVVQGRVANGQMAITIDSGGQTRKSSIAWPRAAGGYFEVDESLRLSPMKAGESRTITTLMPVFNQVGTVELRAVKIEPTSLLEGRRELLRIETSTVLPGAKPIEGVQWTDAAGITLKSAIPALDQVAYRTTKEVALRKSEAQVLDLGLASLVRLKQPLADPHRAKQITYRVHVDSADPASTFASDASQSTTAVDGHTADILVRALRPGSATRGSPAETAPSDDDRQPNSFLQSDDARIIAMAREAAGNEQDPWRVAVALERFVHDKLAKKNYSQTFATAAEVAHSLEGDCTEHAVLLAALLRARGIPSRVAVGLVYVPGEQAFAFHMWTEAFVAGQWIGLDGTLGLGGIGAGHLKLSTTNLKEATALASFLPVAQVLGKMRIEVRP